MAESVTAAVPSVAPAPPVASNPPPVPVAGKGPASATPAIEKPATDPALAEQFAKLTGKEKSLLAEKQKLMQDRKELEDRATSLKSIEEEAGKLKKWQNSAKTDPRAVLEGLFGDDWFRLASELALEKRTPVDLRVSALQDEIEQLRSETQKREHETATQARARSEREAEHAWSTFRTRTFEHVTRAADKYELINAQGRHEDVSAVIKEHWDAQRDMPEDERKLLSVDEAAEHVERWLEQQAEAAFKSRKFASRLTSASTSATTSPQKDPGGSREARSITGSMTQTSAPAPAKPVSEEERTRRAFAAYDAAMARRKTSGT